MHKDTSQTSRKQAVREFDERDLTQDDNGEMSLPDNITYAEFLHLTHPELSETQLRQTIAKEKLTTWLVRFGILGFIVLIAMIVWFATTR